MTSARWGAVVGLVAGMIVLGPSLAPGYLLHYDMVFGPALTFDAQTMGWDGSFPRAVPNDAVVAAMSLVMPGWVAQKILLLAAFVAAGAGAAALVSRFTTSTGAGIVSAVVATWNPWVAERLAIGHWGFLLGWAALGWVAALALDDRADRPKGRWLPLALVAAALSGSTGLILAWLLTICIVRWRARVRVSLIIALLGAPWWYPALFLVDAVPGDPAGVAAFAARDDTGWGAVVSLLSGGGIWNEAAHFADRGQLVIGAAAALISIGVVVFALVRIRAARRIILAGCLGLGLAALPTLPGGREVVEWIVESVPGGGLLRDSHKFAALWMLAICLGAGLAAAAIAAAPPIPRPARGWFVVMLSVWPVALLPTLAWGNGGTWRSVDYPSAVIEVADRVDASAAGDVAVFPWSTFRRFAWNHDRVVLDPWMRLVDRPVVTSDDLFVDGEAVRGENRRSRAISEALAEPERLVATLRDHGVRWVIEWTDQPADERTAWPAEAAQSAELVNTEDSLRVWDLGELDSAASSSPDAPRSAGWWLFVLGVVASAGYVRIAQKNGPVNGSENGPEN